VLNKGDVLFDGDAEEAIDLYENRALAIIERREEAARKERDKNPITQREPGLS
jgi:hypothetical protein